MNRHITTRFPGRGKGRAGALAWLAVLAAAPRLFAASVTGTVLYEGGQTGSFIRVLAATSATAWAAASFDDVPASGGVYALTNLAAGGLYRIRAYLDGNGDGARQLTEPCGGSDRNPWVVTGDIAGVEFTVRDTEYDFDGWTNEVDWRLWDAADAVYPRAWMYGSNYAVTLAGAGAEGGGGASFQIATNGSLNLTVRLAKEYGGGALAFNTMPRPGRYYRVSFDARAGAVNVPMKVHWFNISWLSSNAARQISHYHQPEHVLLGTNWQTYSREVYHDHDPAFNRFGASWIPYAYFDIAFYPLGPGVYAFDNIRMTEIQPDFSLPELDNPGFERGFYGWGDDPAWAHTGIGNPQAEAGQAHWYVCTNNPHSGRRCMAIVLPPFTNHLWTFEPRLFTGGLKLERGQNYLLSYWRRDAAPVVHATTAIDAWSSGIGKRGFNDFSTNWTREVIPFYHYGEVQANTNHHINAGSFAEHAIQIRVDSVRFPWTRRVWVDDFTLERVSADTALAVINHGGTSAPAWTPPAAETDPYALTTAFSLQAPFQMLCATNPLDIPFAVERLDPEAPGGGTLTARIMDYTGQGLHTQQVAFVLTGDTCEATCRIEGFGAGGRLPEGLFTYELSMEGVGRKATDRFFVRDLPPHLVNLPPGEGLLGFDRPDLVKAMDATNPAPKMVLGEYDRDHHMKLLADIGGRVVRLWIMGDSIREVDMLEEAVDSLVAAGYEPLIALNGYVGETNAYRFNHGPLPAQWNEADWTRYVSNLAVRFQGKVRRWQVANEPYGWTVPSYMKVLTNTYSTFKAVDTNVVIHAFEQGLAPSTLDMIQACYEQGAAPFADAVDYHAYYDLAAEEMYLGRLQRIVRAGEGGPSGDAPGTAYLGATNCPVWQTEYGSLWSKVAPGNLVLPGERERAAILLSKMITARAYDVEKFICFNTRPSFQDNHMFLQPLHAGAAGPAICLQYAACVSFASELTGRDLARVYLVNNARVFEFGPREPGGAPVIAAWATAWAPPVRVAEGFPDVELRRMDGSRRVVRELDLTAEPVFLNPIDGASYDWSLLFGTETIEVR